MHKKMRGFTLIELLIVVAIIGILAALLIPNALAAIQKAKQKSAMKEIMTIATGSADYITDHGNWEAVAQTGDIVPGNAFYLAIASFYVKIIPSNDPWNEPYKAEVGLGVADLVTGAGPNVIGDDDFLIYSWGRDTAVGPILASVYTPTTPEAGLYIVQNMASFNEDLVNWSGSWIVAPRTRQPGT